LPNKTIAQSGKIVRPSSTKKEQAGNQIQRIMVDKKGRLWVTSSLLVIPLRRADDFHDYKGPVTSNSDRDNHNITIYQDGVGILMPDRPAWLSYFHPDNFLYFHLQKIKNSILMGGAAPLKIRRYNFSLLPGVCKYNRIRNHTPNI
jgi:hypothetical protein